MYFGNSIYDFCVNMKWLLSSWRETTNIENVDFEESYHRLGVG